MLAAVVNRVDGFHSIFGNFDRQWLAGLRVRLVEWRPRAGNRDADAVAFVENLAHPAYTQRELVDLIGFHQHFVVEAFSISRAPRVVDNQYRAAIGIHVADADDEIRVTSC